MAIALTNPAVGKFGFFVNGTSANASGSRRCFRRREYLHFCFRPGWLKRQFPRAFVHGFDHGDGGRDFPEFVDGASAPCAVFKKRTQTLNSKRARPGSASTPGAGPFFISRAGKRPQSVVNVSGVLFHW